MLGERSHFSTQASVRNAFGDLGRRCCHQDRGHKHVPVPGQETEMGHKDQTAIGHELPLPRRSLKAVWGAGLGWTEGLPQTWPRHVAPDKEARMVSGASTLMLIVVMPVRIQG